MGFYNIIFEQTDEKREKIHSSQRLRIRYISFPGGHVESLPGLLNINRCF